ncbi:tetratricopeptide repeat protein [Luteolibacter soli]|uniref:Tetratricopeptide repeat protein n=1 Tax=Luteolibacter soli TaxID=3135280 RepID=A0ABU9AY46_9BACT
MIEALEEKKGSESLHELTECLVTLGILLRDHGQPFEALPYLARAVEIAKPFDTGSVAAKETLADALMNRGICDLTLATPAHVASALEAFDAAIGIRSRLPLEGYPGTRWGLAAAYMNRGDALTRLHGPTGEAREAYDLAITELDHIGPGDGFDLLQRKALAWTNRGLATGSPDEAIACFSRGIDLLADSSSDRHLLTRCHALLHRGLLHLSKIGDTALAQTDARALIAITRANERRYPAMAEVGLHARHLLCRALVKSLEDGTPAENGDWIAEASDTVEDALSLERYWAARDIRAFRTIAFELFVLGLRIYRVCQPHFLSEFILESLDPATTPGAPRDDPRFLEAAAVAIKQGLDDALVRGASSTLQPEDHAKELAIIDALKAADLRLSRLQKSGQG